MREIKFRAWDSVGKFMYEPVLHPVEDLMPIPFTKLNDYLAGFKPPAILMQYTGLKDKNGKEIYEGDVVSYPVARIDFETGQTRAVSLVGEVMYIENLSAYYIMYCGTGDKPTPDPISAIGGDIVEVIGNRFENPELLEAHP